MKKRAIIGLIILIIIIIILAFIFAETGNNSVKNENSNETNTQNSLNTSYTNEDENDLNSEVQNTENQTSNTTLDEFQENSQSENTSNSEENIDEESDNMNNQNEEIKINLIVNNKTFSATLENNQTTRELVQMFPMTLNMSDLHSNEKYNYLNSSFTTNSSRPSRINAGDIKLYGNDCLVVFYESFSNSYSYTDLGKVDNVNDFVKELGNGSVSITFELAN